MALKCGFTHGRSVERVLFTHVYIVGPDHRCEAARTYAASRQPRAVTRVLIRVFSAAEGDPSSYYAVVEMRASNSRMET